MRRFARAVLGSMVAAGMLAVGPTAVLAAQPACGDTLTADTALNADLDCSAYAGTALYMGANRVVLDLNGHTVWGFTGDDNYYGVDTNGYNRTVVRDGTIANFDIGVYMNDGSQNRVRNVDIWGEAADGNDYGIYAYYGAGNVVRNVETSGVYYGVYGEYGAMFNVLNSDVDADSTALYMYEQTRSIIENNVFTADDYGVYSYYSQNERYIGNRANDGDTGFYFDCNSAGKVTVKNNVANNNDSDGFYLYECYGDHTGWAPGTGAVVAGNTANGNDTGFYDYYSINATWTGNTANDNDSDGFYFEYPAGVTIKNNVARRNGDTGFYLYENYSSSNYNVAAISYNTANRNDYGFYAYYGAPGKGNVARQNTSWNCYNVKC